MIRLQHHGRINPKQEECLRSLNLREIGSASLCSSDLPNTWGMISAVKDFVAVVELGDKISIERVSHQEEANAADGSGMDFERLRYGTNTSPGELVRRRDGSFFAFESDRSNVRMMWSSEVSASRALAALQESYAWPSVKVGQDAATLIVEKDNDYEPTETSVLDAVKRLKDAPAGLIFARLAFKAFEFTWQAPHKPFDDMDAEFAEIGINSSVHGIDVSPARRFASMTGDPEFFRDAGCMVEVRQNGVLKKFSF